MQNPNILLTMLSRMAQKPEVKFAKLFQKLYNVKLWMMAYESIAPNPGNMTPGADGKTIDGMGLTRIKTMIADLKAARYKPTPVRRVYVPKANGKQRPIGIPSFEDKLLQTVVRFILEAIYGPTFSDCSHGFRPGRSCHTALEQVKRMTGTRWWVEGDIQSFFDNLNHRTLLHILSRRIRDRRFLHLIEQFMRAGYIEDWRFHATYSGVPQGGSLSPILSNIYLNELDQAFAAEIARFNRGKRRRTQPEYRRIANQRIRAKKHAQSTGDWSAYKALTQQMLATPASDPQDPDFRRMTYVRYCDDFLVGIIGSKADALRIKQWLADFLRAELQLELSVEKTLITNSRRRVRFLGYDIKKWRGVRTRRYRTHQGPRLKRTCTQHLALLIPRDRCESFARIYGEVHKWRGQSRGNLAYMSEPEILLTYNAEIRGFLGYYALADNLTSVASKILWMTTSSFMRTLADKRRSTVRQVAKNLKQGPNQYAVTCTRQDGSKREYRLFSSTRQLQRKKISFDPRIDLIPSTWQYRGKTELGQRLAAKLCEWCGAAEGPFEVHHVRKIKDLKTKSEWERRMIARQRKTMVLCKGCHVDLHSGRLSEATTR